MSRLNVVIMAAGFSTRLGHVKALARVHGISLLRRTLTIAAELRPARIFIIVPRACARYRQQTRGYRATLLCNTQRASGMASSLRIGVRASRSAAAVLVLPVDLIRLDARSLARLVAHWRASPMKIVAARIGRHGGIPLVLPGRFYRLARSARGDVGLRDPLARLSRDQRILVHLPSAADDVDTAADLARARRSWRRLSG